MKTQAQIRQTTIYGASGAGKTELALTWPKPYALGMHRERGLLTAEGRIPIDYARDWPDAAAKLRAIYEQAVNGQWKYDTLILDGVSHWGDACHEHHSILLAKSRDKSAVSPAQMEDKDGPRAYGDTLAASQWVFQFAQAMPCHVVYTGNEEQLWLGKGEHRTPNGVTLAYPGKFSDKLLQITDHVYLELLSNGTRRLWLSKCQSRGAPARVRVAQLSQQWRLPEFIDDPSFDLYARWIAAVQGQPLLGLKG